MSARPKDGSPDEIIWLRGYEAGVVQTRNDMDRLHAALEYELRLARDRGDWCAVERMEDALEPMIRW